MKRTLLQLFTALFSGVCLGLLWPPFKQTDCIWFALVPLLLLVRYCSVKRALLWGFITGLTSWLIQLFWLTAIIENDAPFFFIYPAWLGLSAVLALFIALFAGLAAWLRQKYAKGPGLGRILLVGLLEPILWGGTECLRSHIFTGFAWNPLGLAGIDLFQLRQLCALGGVTLLSALFVAANGAIATLLERCWWALTHNTPQGRKNRLLLGIETLVPFVCLGVAFFYGNHRIQQFLQISPSDRFTVVLEQTHRSMIAEQTLSEFKNTATDPDVIGLFDVDLWLWPECAVQADLATPNVMTRLLRNFASRARTDILMGGLFAVREGNETLYQNALLRLTPEGLDSTNIYAKRHLVPFGEYIPLDKTFPFLQRFVPTGVSCSPGTRATLTLRNNLTVGPLICFEDTVANLARDAVREGAKVLLVSTNDMWYAHSAEGEQHTQQSILRAIETGTPLVRSCNGAMNTTIDPLGRVEIVDRMPTRVPLYEKPFASLYLYTGDLIFGAPCATIVLILGVCLLLHRKAPRI